MTSCVNNCQCCCNGQLCPNSAMPGNQRKEIRVYGTLMNWTLDPNKSNGTSADPDYHNDAIAYAYQLYDNRFGDPRAIENYQDMINKRLTAISYADGVTTIENRDGSKGDPYMLVVNGNTNIGGNLHVDGDIYQIDEGGVEHKIDLTDILNRLDKLEQLWYYDNNTNKVTTVGNKPAAAYGFYDTDPNMR